MAGELGFDTGPYVNAAAFCDSYIEGKDGVLSLIRLIDRVEVKVAGDNAPDELPPGHLQTTLVVMLKAGEARGGQRFALEIEQPDGTRLRSAEQQIHFAPGPNGGANVIMPIQMDVTSSGLYWADVKVNDRLVTRVPLEIRYSFTRGPRAAE